MHASFSTSLLFTTITTLTAATPILRRDADNTTPPIHISPRLPPSPTLIPLYANTVSLPPTPFTSANLTSSNITLPLPVNTGSPTPPKVYTHTSGPLTITLTRQDEANTLFHIPAGDAHLFAAFSLLELQTQLAAVSEGDSLPQGGKLDIGSRIEGGDFNRTSVHLTVVRDPVTAKGQFTWGLGKETVVALREWTALWEEGAGVCCAGVVVNNGGDAVAQGSFCGSVASAGS